MRWIRWSGPNLYCALHPPPRRPPRPPVARPRPAAGSPTAPRPRPPGSRRRWRPTPTTATSTGCSVVLKDASGTCGH